MRARLTSQPVNRILIACFVLVALVPLTFMSGWLYRTAWDDAWREIGEKHQLLAQNLAAPVQIYVNDHRRMLAVVASAIGRTPSEQRPQHILEEALARLPGFRALLLLDARGQVRAVAGPDGGQRHPASLAQEPCFVDTRASGRWSLSGIKPSPLDGRPTIVLGQPVHGAQGQTGVVLGELQISVIDALRRRIHFGKNGHSAIVDRRGHVIAHPNAAWMARMRDLSSWPIVQRMMRGQTGVTEFYSPFTGEQMVAGYAAVPGIGWGIMVPQPKSEIAAQVHRLLFSHLVWSLVGLLLAIGLALALSRWIARPINRLAQATAGLVARDLHGSIPAPAATAPREVRQLGAALQDLVAGLQRSRSAYAELNASLQERVAEATHRLRDANARLTEAARSDHLTALANRRHFESALGEMLSRRRGDVDSLCLMLIDLDNFKAVNDEHGHAAGDAVLCAVARVLESAMRAGDLVARYGGDEFIAQLRCPPAAARERAEEVHRLIEASRVSWQGLELRVTASIGLLCTAVDEAGDPARLLALVDRAMYQAKRDGRNRVVLLGSDLDPTAA